jgi:S1-C subfamily serine protease
LTRDDYSAVATAVAHEHSASVVLVHHHHVASEQLTSHGTGFIVWSSAKDYLVLTAYHVIELEEHEMNQVEIVVKMPGSVDYLPATVLRIDTARDIALLRVTNNDGNSKTARQPLTFDDRVSPPVGTVVVLLGYFAPDGDVEGQVLVWPDVPGSSPGKIV